MKILISCGLSAIIFIMYPALSKAQETSPNNTYFQYASIDPILGWPEVNLVNMEKVVEDFKLSKIEILQYVSKQYDPKKVDRVQNILYPIEYLSEMIVLEKIRRKLILSKSEFNYEKYQNQLIRTINIYITYCSKLISALKQTQQEQKFKGLEFHFGKSKFEHFIQGIEHYKKQGENQLQEAKRRWLCKLGKNNICLSPNWPPFQKLKPTSYDDSVFLAPSAKIIDKLQRASIVGNIMMKPHLIALQRHQCQPHVSILYYSIWQMPTGNRTPLFRTEVINDVLVHDHSIDKDNPSKYEIELNRLGAKRFLHQPATNHYACPDVGSDTASIRSLIFAHRLISQISWKILNRDKINISKLVNNLSKNSKQIIEKNFVLEAEVHNLMVDVTYLLKNFKESELLEVLGNDQLAMIKRLLLGYKLKTPFLAMDFMNITYNNTAIADYVRYSPWDFYEELLFTRNAPKLLLRDINPSIIRLNFSQTEVHREEISPRLKSYTQELQNNHSVNEFADILLDSANAENKLSKQIPREYLLGH